MIQSSEEKLKTIALMAAILRTRFYQDAAISEAVDMYNEIEDRVRLQQEEKR